MITKNSPLFIAPSIVKKYNATGAFILAQVAYFAVSKGKYDTAHIATANYTGVAKSTVIKYLKLFVDDGIFIKKIGSDAQRGALAFNYQDNLDAKHLYHAYAKEIKKQPVPPEIPSESLIFVDTSQLQGEIMSNMKAERARHLLIYRNILIDKFASNQVNNKSFELALGKWSEIAKLFGCAINTAKSIVNELKESMLLSFSKVRTIVSIRYLTGLAKEITIKVNRLADHIKKNTQPSPLKASPKERGHYKDMFAKVKREQARA